MSKPRKRGFFDSLSLDSDVVYNKKWAELSNEPDVKIRRKALNQNRRREGLRNFKYNILGSICFVLICIVSGVALMLTPRLFGSSLLPFEPEIPKSLITLLRSIAESTLSVVTGEEVSLSIAGMIIENRLLVEFGLAVLLSIVFFFTMLPVYGKPSKANDIEQDIWKAFDSHVTGLNICRRPFLVSARQAWLTDSDIINKYIVKYTFWSRWITKEEWLNEAHLSGILNALGVDKDSLIDIEYGGHNKRDTHYIVIRVNKGGNPSEGVDVSDKYFSNHLEA